MGIVFISSHLIMSLCIFLILYNAIGDARQKKAPVQLNLDLGNDEPA